MAEAPRILLILSMITFIVAVVTTFTGNLYDIPPEGFSRASTNMALLAIGCYMIHGTKDSDSD